MKNQAAASYNGVTVSTVRKYKIPKYPTQAEAFGDPELLRKLPPSWAKNVTVKTAAGLLGALALVSYAAGNEPAQSGNNPDNGNLLKVAPIFEHGRGTGSTGCSMVVPPVFLSEQEALAVIKSAAADAGIFLNDSPPGYVATSNRRSGITALGNGSVSLELFDAKKKIAASFISMREAEVLIEGFMSSVSNYSARELAEMSAEDFARQNGDIVVGVFYDPGTSGDKDAPVFQMAPLKRNPDEKTYDEYLNEYLSDTTAYLKKQLRAQVLDFIEWLQAQGII